MSNCDNSANSQLKALQARLDRIDDDLMAHYAGVSQLVAGLAANPITAGSVAPSLATYNFNSAGQRLLKKLMGLIPGHDTFKQLQHLDSAAMLEGMSGKLAAQAQQMVETAAQEQALALVAQVQAKLERTAAIMDFNASEFQQLQSALDLAQSLPAGQARDEAVALAEEELTTSAPFQLRELQGVLDAAQSLPEGEERDTAVAFAEDALSEGISNLAPSLLPFQNEVQNSINSVKRLEGAVNSVLSFITTMSDIADCRTRTAIIR